MFLEGYVSAPADIAWMGIHRFRDEFDGETRTRTYEGLNVLFGDRWSDTHTSMSRALAIHVAIFCASAGFKTLLYELVRLEATNVR